MVSRERLVATLDAIGVCFLVLAVLLRPLVCGLSGGLATNMLVTLPVLGAGFLWIMSMVMRQEVRLRRTPLDAPVLFLLLFALASVGAAAYRHAAASAAFDWFCYVALFYIVVNRCAEQPRLRRMLLAAILASALVVSLNGILQRLYSLALTRELFLQNQESWVVTLGLPRDAVSDFVGRLATGRVFSTFLLPNTCAGFLGLMIPLQAALLLSGAAGTHNQPRWRRNVFLAVNLTALLASLLCLYYTKSKGGWISLALVALIFLAVRGRTRLVRYWKAALGAGAGLVVLFAALQLTRSAPPLDEYLESFTVRAQYWRAGLMIIRDHPVTGVGLNNFGDYYPEYRRPQDDESLMAHNNFIQVGAETGLFGLLAFCVVWGAFFRAMRGGVQAADVAGELRPLDRETDTQLTAGMAALLGFAMIYAMFNSFEPIPKAAPWLLTACLGAIWACAYFANASAPDFRGETGDWVRQGVVYGIIFFLIHSLVEFDLYEQGVAQTAWLLMGIALAPQLRGRTPLQFKLGSAGQMAVALPTILLTGLLLCAVYPRFIEAKVRRETARDFFALKDEQKALAELAGAADLDPWDSETQMALAEVYRQRWDQGVKQQEDRSTHDLALQHVRRAAELNPRRARYRHFLARLYQEMALSETDPQRAGDLRRAALGEFEEAHRLFPSRATYAASLALAYDEAGRRAEAVDLYAKALELDDVQRPERFTAKLPKDVRLNIERRLAKERNR